MTGAMYAAIAGLRAHMQKLSVIGNNVANVNTYGYKAHRTTFKEAIYSTVTGGSNGTDSVGGVNPSQIGFGCSVGSIDLMMGTANYAPTGNNLDCMIDGDGFFLVGDKAGMTDGVYEETAAKDLKLSRHGDFTFDSQGYLVDSGGNVVYGWVTVAGNGKQADGTYNQAEEPGTIDKSIKEPSYSTQLVPIRLPMAAKDPAADNTGGNAGGGGNAGAGGGAAGTTTIPAGTAIYPGVGDDGMNVYDTGAGDDALSTGKPVQLNNISVDGQTGQITGVNKETSEIVIVGYIALASVDNPSGVTHIGGHYYRAMDGAGECYAASVKGAVKGLLNNGKSKTPAAGGDAVAPDSIHNSGETTLMPGGLETSGADLATEISEMITTQRGYQANTRIITVTDSMLEELVNMKR